MLSDLESTLMSHNYNQFVKSNPTILSKENSITYDTIKEFKIETEKNIPMGSSLKEFMRTFSHILAKTNWRLLSWYVKDGKYVYPITLIGYKLLNNKWFVRVFVVDFTRDISKNRPIFDDNKLFKCKCLSMYISEEKQIEVLWKWTNVELEAYAGKWII
jgi:hypothetical protein